MSKLDSLLSMVDTISSRSDKLLSTMNDSSTLISSIMESNASISRYDLEIDSMSQLVSQNSAFLAEFQTLYEKSFFLESNFGLNDSCVNDTSFGNLYGEYDFLWNEFHAANTKSGSIHSRHSANTVMTMGHSPDLQVSPEPQKKVKNSISISNLNLKPLRCRDSKVSKQKSRYRLSEAYTLNPLQALPVRDVSESSAYTRYSDIMEGSDRGNHDESSSFSTITGSPMSETYDDKLSRTPQFSRAQSSETTEFNDPSSSPLLFRSLQSSAYDTADADEIDSSGLSSHSPDSRFEGFDNFHHFLRQSRVNLQETFPVLQRSRSDDSMLSTVRVSPPSSVALHNIVPPKFHNPAASITLIKSLSTQPTVEAIYSTSADMASKFREHSARLLATQPQKESQSDSTTTTPKKSQSFDLFRLMNSPLGSPRGFKQSQPKNIGLARQLPTSTSAFNTPERRNSVDLIGKSLASTFMSLVSTSTLTRTADQEIGFGIRSKSPPEKIKKMKKNLKNPIAPQNEIKSKRLPPSDRHLRNGSSSSLTIGPNKTKIINHGGTSVFKKPTLRRLSQTLLADALNESILFS